MVRLTKKSDPDKVELLSSSDQVDLDSGRISSDNDGYHHTSDILSEKSDTDLIFLQALLDNNSVAQTIRVDEPIIKDHFFLGDSIEFNPFVLVEEVIHICYPLKTRASQELIKILNKPHVKGLILAHNDIKQELTEEDKKDSFIYQIELTHNEMRAGNIKMVGIRKHPKEPLGLTVEVDEHSQLVVARILAGGMIDKQGLLHPGDVILEVNAVAVTTPEELQQEISRSKESITLKIGPNVEEEMKSARLTMSGGHLKNGKNLEPGTKLTCYMRALYTYDPSEDSLLPCKEIGLSFKQGDILQIINVKDPNWWQAKNITENSEKIGLIPSQELEERRKAFVPPEADYVHKIGICGTRISKKKRKTMYKSVANCEFDKADLMLYEEVTRMPPFKRKSLVLIGVKGVGRRTLKNRLIHSDPEKFGAITPHTTRPRRPLEENGKTYWFVDREDFENDVKSNKFLEYGELNGNLYGSHFDSIRDVIKNGKMCILDCAPNALKLLHNSTELMPFVIFIAAPGMEQLQQIYAERRATGGSSRSLAFDRQSSIRYSSRRARTLESLASLYEDDDLVSAVEESKFLQRKYEKYFDMVIVNEDFDETFRQVVEALEQLSHEHQWVPVNWIY